MGHIALGRRENGMGVYSEGLGRFLERNDLSLKVSGSEAAPTTHAAVEVGDARVLNLEVVVTVTPSTLVITIEGSHDNATWYTLGKIGSDGFSVGMGTAPANITGVGTFRAALPAARFVRSKSSTLTGTPTYSIGGSSA
jgi:hypothetical protein